MVITVGTYFRFYYISWVGERVVADLDEKGNPLPRGQTEAGRHLQVVYVPDPEGYAVFVVTAYDLKGKALMAFRRRKRRKRP